MEYGVDFMRVEACDQATRLLGRNGVNVDAPTASLLDDVGHDRHGGIRSRADDQPTSAPRQVLVSRQRSVPEFLAVRLGGFLLPFPHLATVDDDVVLVLM